MKNFWRILLLIGILLFPGYASATHYSSSRIMRYATHTPRVVEKNLHVLVKHLIRPLDDDYDKAQMIAFWIASHISYDEYLYSDGERTKLSKRYSGQSPQELLESRVGICGDYAKLFVEMCKIAGIKCKEVSGYVYEKNGRYGTTEQKNNARHAWNYFYYEGRKVYVDVTFMAGGRLSVMRRTSETSHKRALKKFKKSNDQKSRINPVNEYYFDFDYKDEKKKLGYKRKEV